MLSDLINWIIFLLEQRWSKGYGIKKILDWKIEATQQKNDHIWIISKNSLDAFVGVSSEPKMWSTFFIDEKILFADIGLKPNKFESDHPSRTRRSFVSSEAELYYSTAFIFIHHCLNQPGWSLLCIDWTLCRQLLEPR